MTYANKKHYLLRKYIFICLHILYVYIFYQFLIFSREPTRTDGNQKTSGGEIMSIAWVIGLQNSSYAMDWRGNGVWRQAFTTREPESIFPVFKSVVQPSSIVPAYTPPVDIDRPLVVISGGGIPYPRADKPFTIPPHRTAGSFVIARINGRSSFRITHAWTLRLYEGNITNQSTPGILTNRLCYHKMNERAISLVFLSIFQFRHALYINVILFYYCFDASNIFSL